MYGNIGLSLSYRDSGKTTNRDTESFAIFRPLFSEYLLE